MFASMMDLSDEDVRYNGIQKVQPSPLVARTLSPFSKPAASTSSIDTAQTTNTPVQVLNFNDSPLQNNNPNSTTSAAENATAVQAEEAAAKELINAFNELRVEDR